MTVCIHAFIQGLKMLKQLIKDRLLNTSLARYFCVDYPFEYLPTNLMHLADLLTSVADVSGNIVEVGALRGATTIWLNKVMNAAGNDGHYYAIDTFSGFVESHVLHEAQQRAKDGDRIRSHFLANSQKWFDKSMQLNGIDRVTSICGDAATLDYTSMGQLSFVLVDVDIYIPVLESLKRITPLMSKGGIIVVDDCKDNHLWDGAYQAYREHVASLGQSPEIINDKLGIIRF